MRCTGLRVGELMSLEQNCIRIDYQENKFLKVPLGKLNNERLVPLDEKTVGLIEKLQCKGSRHRTWLLEKHHGKKTQYHDYRRVLNEACQDLEIDGKMTTHRLRHSYATALLNGGMSLVGVMNLLGHRDYRMTLRYTAITQETVGKEYFEALLQIEKKYSVDLSLSKSSSETDPIKLLSDVARLIQNHSANNNSKIQAARSLIKRIQRIQTALKMLMS
jgi:integrase